MNLGPLFSSVIIMLCEVIWPSGVLGDKLNWSYVKLSMDQTKDLNLMLIQTNYESNAQPNESSGSN